MKSQRPPHDNGSEIGRGIEVYKISSARNEITHKGGFKELLQNDKNK